MPVLLADRFLPGGGVAQILALGLYACVAGHKLLHARRPVRTRSLIWALFSLVFFAQLALGLAGVARV